MSLYAIGDLHSFCTTCRRVFRRKNAFTAKAEAYSAKQLIYAHSHGEARFHDSILGERNGIRCSLVSGDYLRWRPMKVLG